MYKHMIPTEMAREHMSCVFISRKFRSNTSLDYDYQNIERVQANGGSFCINACFKAFSPEYLYAK